MKPFKSPILVTRPYLPDFEKYQQGCAEIWKNQWLTNNGPILQRYEKNLQTFFGTSNVCAFNNGTLALQIALQGMKIDGEVITTPFTFVATAHSLVWNNIKPIFVEIDPVSYTLDPRAVEAAITSRTTAILAVHVYGNLCDLHALQKIADKHHLNLIYDAAHAFGVTVNGKSIGLFGDCSMFSLHSTKLYHSIEGGLLTFGNSSYKKTFEYLRNFGFKNETEVMMIGTNAKMNEMQALMGDLILADLPVIIKKRKQLIAAYVDGLQDVEGLDIHVVSKMLELDASCGMQMSESPATYSSNFAYCPIEVLSSYSLSRDQLYEELKKYNVFARRYFYPLLTDFICYRGAVQKNELPIAESIASRILTLPIYFDLGLDDVQQICAIIRYLSKP